MESSVVSKGCGNITNPPKYPGELSKPLTLSEMYPGNGEDLFDDLDEACDDDLNRGYVVHSDYTDSNEGDKELRYYSIYDAGWLGQIIYNDKHKALKMFKDMKYARLKCFRDLEKAIDFATNGWELSFNFKFPTVEKVIWRTPRFRDLVEFRKTIQCKNLKTVMSFIEENPRYLVGNGDTPTILQEGCRYNALHVSAMASSASVCSYILSTVSDIAFAERLYGKNQDNQRRIEVLLDLYLNMPDKGFHETPLHFASKYGALDVIKVLISYPQCDKNLKNKSGLTALEVACNRFRYNPAVKKEIAEILGRPFFVPLLRSKGNVVQPVVGEPCTSDDPPISSKEKLESPLEVKAVAGPMNEELARRFRKKWKTPPRNLKNIPNEHSHLSDPEKGFEKLGRKLAGQFQVGWKEYWDFLDSFVDLSSREGLLVLDFHLKNKYEDLGDICPLEQEQESILSMSQLLRSTPRFRHRIAACKEESSRVHDSCIVSNSSPSTPTNYFRNNLEHIDKSSSGEKRIDFSPIDTNEYYQVFAKRIANALIVVSLSEMFFEVSYFHKFLIGCCQDEILCKTDLTVSHYRLSVLITKMLSEKPESLSYIKQSLNEILIFEAKDLDDNPCILEVEDLLKVTKCIFQLVNELLSCQDGSPELESRSSGGGKSCECKISSIKIKIVPNASLSRRLSFSDGDSSVSEESFHTARSYAEDAENDCTPQSATPSVVFLTGHSPTKVDVAVLEAIESVSLSSSDYPYLSRWKVSFQKLYEKCIQYYNSQ